MVMQSHNASSNACNANMNTLYIYHFFFARLFRAGDHSADSEVSFLTYGNAIFILIFLRTVVPRLLVPLGCLAL